MTLVPPVLVKVTVCDCCVPVVTLPKDSLAGLEESCPGCIPVPERPTVAVALEALLVTVTAALNAPAALGENITLIGVLCPAARVIGRLVPVREKYLVEIEALVTVIEAGPGFVAEMLRVLLLPAVTLPKARVAFPRESVLVC